MSEALVAAVLQRSKTLERRKEPWKTHWQLLGEYIHTRKQEFTSEHDVGEFLNRELFDATGSKAAKIAASSILSMMWPQAVRRLVMERPRSLKGTREEKEYYEYVSAQMLDTLDNPKSGLQTSFDEYMLDQMCFATSGIEVLEDQETDVMYRPWGVKHMSIAEGEKGFVDTAYLNLKWTVAQVVDTYGVENVSAKTKELYENEHYDKEVTLLIAIEPRRVRDRTKRGNKNMPWRSVHIERDAKHLLREAGFNEMPIKVGRFTKLIGEIYGRGFGMDALPDILESNAIWEAVTVAIEKLLDPPLGVLDDGRLGAGEIDTSAGALSVFNVSGRAGDSNPIFPLFTVGEIKDAAKLLERLEESISNHFSIDRLLDFNNEQRMTLGEAQLRNQLRNATLASIFSRQIAEVFNPTVERTFNILLKRGKLGIRRDSADALTLENPVFIPDSVAKLMDTGQDVYKIKYFTPAQRIMQSEEAGGIARTWEMAGQISGLNPEVIDNLDADESIRRFREIVGAPSEMDRAKAEVKAIRAARGQKQEEDEQLQTAQGVSEAIRNVGQSNMLPGTRAA